MKLTDNIPVFDNDEDCMDAVADNPQFVEDGKAYIIREDMGDDEAKDTDCEWIVDVMGGTNFCICHNPYDAIQVAKAISNGHIKPTEGEDNG